jgi:hypothetical protein
MVNLGPHLEKLANHSNDPLDLVDTHVGPTHGQSLGQTPLKA